MLTVSSVVVGALVVFHFLRTTPSSKDEALIAFFQNDMSHAQSAEHVRSLPDVEKQEILKKFYFKILIAWTFVWKIFGGILVAASWYGLGAWLFS